jgi:hypothetical protein
MYICIPTSPKHTCSVYMALPSACRLMTVLLGQAMAAPKAMGGPLPMLPPVTVR